MLISYLDMSSIDNKKYNLVVINEFLGKPNFLDLASSLTTIMNLIDNKTR